MGYFPYDCVKCGGGDARCGSSTCKYKNCEGGQFCWEDSMYFKVGRGVWVSGTYTGYGRMKVDGDYIDKPLFGGMRGIQLNERNEMELEDNRDRGEVYCASCRPPPPKINKKK